MSKILVNGILKDIYIGIDEEEIEKAIVNDDTIDLNDIVKSVENYEKTRKNKWFFKPHKRNSQK